MMSQKILASLPRTVVISRQLSSASKLTTIEVNDKTGIATLTMNRPPINALNVELLQDLHKSIQDIESNKSRGLILTSVRPLTYLYFLLLIYSTFRHLRKCSPPEWTSMKCTSPTRSAYAYYGAPFRMSGRRSMAAIYQLRQQLMYI